MSPYVRPNAASNNDRFHLQAQGQGSRPLHLGLVLDLAAAGPRTVTSGCGWGGKVRCGPVAPVVAGERRSDRLYLCHGWGWNHREVAKPSPSILASKPWLSRSLQALYTLVYLSGLSSESSHPAVSHFTSSLVKADWAHHRLL